VGFPQAANRLFLQNIATTGTPVRPQFQSVDAAACRMALGLKMEDPVLLVMGGSQGASGINQMVLQSAPKLLEALPGLQFLHLTGPGDFEKVKEAYAAFAPRAVVKPFLSEMEFALGAATVAISRAGASSLAEMAAMRLPAILIPYPSAADNHQYYNARAFADSGAAVVFQQARGGGTELAALAVSLLKDSARQTQMRQALEKWHSPDAAEMIAEKILYWMRLMGKRQPESTRGGGAGSGEFANPKSVLA
jgi:UDP-N-acetylglucosamine--N-acetylmuramyl-(pentapeptide) pyrophosphoryl-undecaprenol N-acetylglucosamine transferase